MGLSFFFLRSDSAAMEQAAYWLDEFRAAQDAARLRRMFKTR
jgi:hypothetical protein